MRTRSKLIQALAITSMVAGIATATTVWNPAANGIAPPAVGYWDEALNWTAGVPGNTDPKAVFNVANAAECVVTNTQSGARVIQGDNGAADAGTLRIASTGDLTAMGDWSAIGYNRKAYCIVEAGGVYSFDNHAWIGQVSGGDGTLDLYGTFNIGGQFGLGFEGGKGTATVYQGGKLNLSTINGSQSINGNSSLDLWGDGLMTISGDYMTTISNYVAAGKIMGNRLTNNLEIVLDTTTTPGETNTVVNSIDSIPNIAGLSLTEATNTLAQFGFLVGNITVGYVPGALTDYVVDQNPAAGDTTPLAPGSAIDLVTQETSIPNIVGLVYADATNVLAQVGLTVGVVTTNYIFDTTPTLVLDQDPASGGSADVGDPVSMTIMQPLAAETSNQSVGIGNWMNVLSWSLGVVPERETQGYKVQGVGGSILTLTNMVAVKTLVGGDGAAFQLDIQDGGHFVGGQFGDWNAIGYNGPTTLNVYTGGVFECRKNLLYGWANNGTGDPSTCYMNIDGGTVWIGDWMSIGVNGYNTTETVVKNGGSLSFARFRNDMTNGVITVYEGTVAMHGTGRMDDMQSALDLGTIVVAPGYVGNLSNASGDTVLTVSLPGYDSWAKSWGVATVGTETEDYDMDGALNLYEYALDGDPTNVLVLGEDPVYATDGGMLTYTYLSRDDDTNLVYTVVTTDNLDIGVWTEAGTVEIGENITGDDYNVVTNEIITTVRDESFVRLLITNP